MATPTTPIIGTVPYGAAQDFTNTLLGGLCDSVDYFVQAQVTSSLAIVARPDRVALVLINFGLNIVYVTFTFPTISNEGIILNPNGGSLTMTVRDDFTLTAREFYLTANGGVTPVYVVETFRVKKGF